MRIVIVGCDKFVENSLGYFVRWLTFLPVIVLYPASVDQKTDWYLFDLNRPGISGDYVT